MTSTIISNLKRVLAVDPTSRGFGYAVMESPATIIDWGVKSAPREEEATTLKKVSELIRLYRPETLILEDPKNSRRCLRIQKLLIRISKLGRREGLEHRLISTSHVKDVFRTFGAKTKYQTALEIARQIPELASRLPKFRRAWMSEDYRMSIFDATALALSYLYSHTKPLKDKSNK